MPLFLITARDKPASLDLRMKTRLAHVEHLQSIGARLKVAGPTVDGNGDPDGSVVVIEADDLDAAKAFADADPYAKAELFASVDVRAWRAPLGVWSEQ